MSYGGQSILAAAGSASLGLSAAPPQATPAPTAQELMLNSLLAGAAEKENEKVADGKYDDPPHTPPSHRQLKEKEAGLLYPVEAQWILSVLGDCSDKLFLASVLTPNILDDPLLNSTKDRNPLIVHLDAFFEAQDKYLQLVHQREQHLLLHGGGPAASAPVGSGSSSSGSSGAWTDGQRRELERSEDVLSDSCRVSLRLLKANPSLIRRLRELTADTVRAPSVVEFINTFYRLRNLWAAKLRQTLEKEKEDELRLDALKLQNDADALRLEEKKKKLREQHEQHTRALQEKSDKIARLQAEYEREKAKMEEKRNKMLAEMAEEAKKHEREFLAVEAERVAALAAARAELEERANANFADENGLHEQRYRRTVAVRDAVRKYDADLTHKFDTTVQTRADYTRETSERLALQGKFDALDAQDAAAAAEQAAVRLQRNAALENERKRFQAATLIQKLFRGYYIRQKAAARRARIRARKEAKTVRRDVLGNVIGGASEPAKKSKSPNKKK